MTIFSCEPSLDTCVRSSVSSLLAWVARDDVELKPKNEKDDLWSDGPLLEVMLKALPPRTANGFALSLFLSFREDSPPPARLISLVIIPTETASTTGFVNGRQLAIMALLECITVKRKVRYMADVKS